MVLIVCLEISLLNFASASLSIPVMPLSDGMRFLPIKVYWMDSGACSPQEREAMRAALEVALGIYGGSISRLEQEYPEGFSGFGSLRFAWASEAGSAQIIVTDAVLTSGSGRTRLMISGDGRVLPPARIEINCQTASAGAAILVTTILHELGHALGLGHTGFSEYGGIKELMYPVQLIKEDPIYPSTLDLYAIYELVIKGYAGSSISLPEWLPYMQVSSQGLIVPEKEEVEGEEPTVEEATIQDLERKYEDLRRKYESLSETIADLGNDIQRIEERLDELEEAVGLLENRTGSLEERINITENVLAEHAEKLDRLSRSLSKLEDLEAEMELVEKGITALSTRLNEELRSIMSDISELRETSNEAIMNLTREHDLLESRLTAQGEALSQDLSRVSRRVDDVFSEVDQLRLRVSELEEELEARETEIAHLRILSFYISLFLAASIIIASIALARAPKAVKTRAEA